MGGLDPPIQTSTIAPMPSGFLYIMASNRNGTLHIGVTSNLSGRVCAHREGSGSEFCKKYGVNRLVYYEEHPLYSNAIGRENNLKRWKRKWKLELIEKMNPNWDDLYEQLNS